MPLRFSWNPTADPHTVRPTEALRNQSNGRRGAPRLQRRRKAIKDWHRRVWKLRPISGENHGEAGSHGARPFQDGLYGGQCEIGVQFFKDTDDFCEEHPEIILICASITLVEAVLKSLPTQRLKRSTLFADVLSVKEFPRRLFLQVLPPEFDVLCTHPMFGPESGKDGWGGLPFVYDKVRVSNEGLRAKRCERFLDIFSREGCRMVEMSCAEHDRYVAESQFITHTIGRMLGRLGLESTPISTKGYEKLLEVAWNIDGDSFDIYYGLFMYNVNSIEQIERLDMAFNSLKNEVSGSN